MKKVYLLISLFLTSLFTFIPVFAVSVSSINVYPLNAYENSSYIYCNATLTGNEANYTAEVEFGHNVSGFPYLFNDYWTKILYGGTPVYTYMDLVEYKGYLYGTFQNNKLWKMNRDGTYIQDIIVGSKAPQYFTIWNDSIYFVSDGVLLRYNLSGDWQENISLSYIPSYYGGIDINDDYIYIYDNVYQTIGKYYHNGTFIENISLGNDITKIRVSNSKIYGLAGIYNGKIYEFNLSGTLLNYYDLSYYLVLNENNKYYDPDYPTYNIGPYGFGANLTNRSSNLFPFYFTYYAYKPDIVGTYAFLTLGYAKNITVNNNTETTLYKIGIADNGINNTYYKYVPEEEYICKVTPYNSTGAGTTAISEARWINDKTCPVPGVSQENVTLGHNLYCKLHEGGYLFGNYNIDLNLDLNGSSIYLLDGGNIVKKGTNTNIKNGNIYNLGGISYYVPISSVTANNVYVQGYFYAIITNYENITNSIINESGYKLYLGYKLYVYNSTLIVEYPDYILLQVDSLAEFYNSKINSGTNIRINGNYLNNNITIENCSIVGSLGGFVIIAASINPSITIKNSNITATPTNPAYGLFGSDSSGANSNVTLNIYNSNLNFTGTYLTDTANYTVNCYNCTYLGSLSKGNEIRDKGWINRYWYLNTNITNLLGNPIEGANVTIKDKYGNLIFSGLTDSNGKIPQQNIKEYFANSTTTIYYSNYTINASKGNKWNYTEVNMTGNKIISLVIPNNPPKINSYILISPSYFFEDFILRVNATDLDSLSDRNTLSFLSFSNSNLGTTNPIDLDIGIANNYAGDLTINDSIGDSDSIFLNFTLTNNSYQQNTSFQTSLSEQRIYKSDTLTNNAPNNLSYNITHYNKYNGNLITGGNFVGELIGNSQVNLYSEWSGDWLINDQYKQYTANITEAGRNAWITRDINNTIDINFTNVQNIDRLGWTCTKSTINISANQFIANATICNKTNVITKSQTNNTILNDTIIVDKSVNAYYNVSGTNTDPEVTYHNVLVDTTVPSPYTNTSSAQFLVDLAPRGNYNLRVNITGTPVQETEYTFITSAISGGEKASYNAKIEVLDSAASSHEIWYYIPKSRLQGYDTGISKSYTVDDRTSGFDIQETDDYVIIKIPTTFSQSSLDLGNHSVGIYYWLSVPVGGGGGGAPTAIYEFTVEPKYLSLNITKPGNYTVPINLSWTGPPEKVIFDYTDNLENYVVSPKRGETIPINNTTTVNVTFSIPMNLSQQLVSTLIKRITGKLQFIIDRPTTRYVRFTIVEISLYKYKPVEEIYKPAVCGNGICELDKGENFINCPEDCLEPYYPEIIQTALVAIIIGGALLTFLLNKP